ncbi:MAG: DinB family protein, partial [bacterium]
MDPSLEDHWKTIEELHKDIFEAVEPLSDDQINWRHPALTNTIAILLRHVAGSERWWIGEVIGGRPMHRVRDTEFEHERLQKAPLVEGLHDALGVVKEVLEQTTPADLRQVMKGTRRGKAYRYTKEWALLHS